MILSEMTRTVAIVCGLCIAVVGVRGEGGDVPGRAPVYPKARTVECVEEVHGVKVADPYRWMEEMGSEEVKEWIDAQNKLTFGYLAEIPAREAIRRRLTQLWDYERYGMPVKRGNRYFYLKNDGLQNQSVLYVAESLEGEARVLLDPNVLSKDGTVALAGYAASEDGELLAYGLSSAGSDWIEYQIRRVKTGEDFPDRVRWVKFSGVSWTKDGRGFYYGRYPEPTETGKLQSVNYFQKLYFHRIGTPQSEDRLVYERPDRKEWLFRGRVTDDGRYLVIHVEQGTERRNRVYYLDLASDGGQVVRLLDDGDAHYAFIDNDGPVFWFLTDLDAPRNRLIAIDTGGPARQRWKEIIPESKDTLDDVSAVGNLLVAVYMQDAHSRVRVFDLKGTLVREVPLPGMGSVEGFAGRRSDRETFYAFTGFSVPTTIYRYDVRAGKSTVFRQPRVAFDPADYETTQVFYESRDGTRVPMFLTHRKGLAPDGNRATYLYGYGGFGIPMMPRFWVTNVVWMEMGGVYALANIRGGGEYGTTWHDAGRLKNKQNCFDDFIGAAEWLIDKGYTRRDKLAIGGGSNGGLLVGACITQRPELFGAALPSVGVMDMLRFNRSTIGWAWTYEYGNPDDPELFRVLRAYSPLHNLRPGVRYPATLITTGDHDDRVVPWHSFKFAAAMQAAQAGNRPVLIRVETRAGHGAGKPTAKMIEESTDRWAFLVRTLGMDASGFVEQSGRKGPTK